MQQKNNDDFEIDIKELFHTLFTKAWIFILSGIICALSMGIYSKFIITPIYTSSTKVYVINRQNKETTTYSDLQTGTQLTMDYKILVLSRPVTEQVIGDLNLNMTHDQLVSNITVNTPQNTRILEISVKNPDPLIAKQLADGIARVSAEQMVSVMEMEKVNIVEPANLPTVPSEPSVKKNSIIGGVVGGFLAAVIIIIIYLVKDTFNSSEEVEKHLGITTLGLIPYHAKKTKNRRPNLIKRVYRKVFREKNTFIKESEENRKEEPGKLSFASIEAFKTLRTNLLFCGKDLKTICITSSLPNEGKTEVSFQLTKVIAESGKKVLFIDADLRKSVLLNRLKINNPVYGLSQYISGMNELEDIINKTNIDNLDIIFAGPIPPNPSEMLESDTFREFLHIVRKAYDYIIVDTPPLGIVIDGANVAKVCDGTILVIEANKTSYKLAQKVLWQLEKGNCRMLGVVLNKLDIKRKGYYGRYYGKYYGKNEDL